MLGNYLGKHILSQDYFFKAYIYIYMLNKYLEKNAALPPSWALLSKAQIQASSKKFPCEKLQIILDY